MKTFTPIETNEPCLPIQADLSAMLDGELDAAVVRRVMVHSDACPSCCSFLRGIRRQANAHRQLVDAQMIDPSGTPHTADAMAAVLDQVQDEDPQTAELRRRLLENQRQLAKILYELGRGFVLMGVNPEFSRVVAREPVPVPDMCLRGRNLLDEVERLSSCEQVHVGQEWVRAKVLFAERENRDPIENLAKGKRLLCESLVLWPDYHEARIYLGHAYHVEQEHEQAAREFRQVIDTARNPLIRAFALENLGNLRLEQDQLEDAVALFRELVESGIVDQEPRFYTAYFNMVLTYGLMKKFDDCEFWLSVLDERFPHRRRFLAAEFARRSHFAKAIDGVPGVRRRLAERFPAWFDERPAQFDERRTDS